MAFQWPTKDPNDVLDYGVDWREFLVSDLITSSVWALSPNDGNLMVVRSSFSPQIATVWLSGGVVNQVYAVTNTITTQAGRQVDQTVNIFIQNR